MQIGRHQKKIKIITEEDVTSFVKAITTLRRKICQKERPQYDTIGTNASSISMAITEGPKYKMKNATKDHYAIKQSELWTQDPPIM